MVPVSLLASDTVVSYGVLTNLGALSLMSETLTMTGMVRFFFVDLTVQRSWRMEATS